LENSKVGPTTNFDNVQEYDFSQVYVATQADSAAKINAKLDQGLHVVLCSGNYFFFFGVTYCNKTKHSYSWNWISSYRGNTRKCSNYRY